MERFTTPVKVGLFTVVTVVAGFFIYRYVSKTAGTGDGYTLYALMSDATGIAKHSQVRIAGIPVGHIESIRLEAGQARIDVRLRPDIAVYEDSAVAKVSSSLLGEYFLSIAPGTEGRRQLTEGERIPNVIEAATTDQILKDVAHIADKVKRVADALADSIGTEKGQENLKSTLQNLADVTESLNQTVRENRESIRTILKNVEGITTRGGPQVEQILADVRETTREVRELVKDAEDGRPGAASEVRDILSKVSRASSDLEKSLANLEEVSGRIERGEGTLGRLSKDEKLIDEVEGVAESVGEFVGGLSRVQTVVGLRTDYQFLANTVKTYFSLRIQPREDKYYLIEVINDPRGNTRIEQIDVESSNPNDPPNYREVRTVTTNAFRFSLQFAQRFGPLTGRFGLKESTGGVGLDLHLLDDRFELESDMFGFGEVVRPRIRLGIGYEFINRLWLLGGADDILSPDRRDYFIGLRLRFNDEDLKTILPFAPGP